MRYKALAVLLVAVVGVPGVARAGGPSGSSENKKTKHVKCGQGTATPQGKVYAGANGIEVCSDDNASPDGRVILSPTGYIVVDGDPTNSSFQGTGFVRIDSSGVSCGNAKKTDGTAGPGGACA